MKIQVYDPVIKNWNDYRIVDLDTGDEIKLVIWADDDTGEYECYSGDVSSGKPYAVDGNFVTERKCGNIKIVKKDDL